MSDPTSRWQIVDSPALMPGCCGICGTEKGPFVDTGLQFEFYGALYFCLLDVFDMGRQAGLVDPVAVDDSFLDARIVYNALPSLINDVEADIRVAFDKLRGSTGYVESTLPLAFVGSTESKVGVAESESSNSEELSNSGADDSTPSIEKSTGISSDPGSNFQLK